MSQNVEKSVEIRESVVLLNEGQKIFGTLHRPKQESPAPVVVMCHGFGGHKTGKYRVYVLLAMELAKVGIASLRLDFRGSGDSEGILEEMTFNGEVSDALVGVDYLREHPQIDSSRIAFFGRSLGGAVATRAASQTRETKSVVLWAPVYNGDQWREIWDRMKPVDLTEEQRKELLAVNGQISGIPFYQELFALDLSNALQELSAVPMLLIHPENDEVVTIAHTEQYLRKRDAASAKTVCTLLTHSDHDFSHFDERASSIAETVAWFKETL